MKNGKKNLNLMNLPDVQIHTKKNNAKGVSQ